MPKTKDVKAVRFDLALDEHKRLRIEAAKADMSMSAFVRSSRHRSNPGEGSHKPCNETRPPLTTIRRRT